MNVQNIPFKYWKTDIIVDIQRLQQWFKTFKEKNPPHRYNHEDDVYQTHQTFGLGAYGWQLYETNLEGGELIEEEGTALKSPLMSKRARYRFPNGEVRKVQNQDYTIRSQICSGYMATILDEFPEAYRCGMKVMRSDFKYKVHVDPPHEQHFRAHIAIYSNYDSGHEVLGEKFHIPVDGHIWFINSGVEHTAWNYGHSDRIHVYWQMPIETFRKYKERSMMI